jgi:hypothetical protein
MIKVYVSSPSRTRINLGPRPTENMCTFPAFFLLILEKFLQRQNQKLPMRVLKVMFVEYPSLIDGNFFFPNK